MGLSIFVPPPPIIIVTAGDTALVPALSVAFAVKECAPAARLVVTEYGAVVENPSDVLASKNSTLAIVPELAEALAVIVIFVGPANVAPFAGSVIVTVGAAP